MQSRGLEGGVTLTGGSTGGAPSSSQLGACNMYVYIKRVRSGGRVYYYLVVEKYEGKGRRRVLAHIPLKPILEGHGLEEWCGGWDLNPRRPTPSGPKPDPFGQARAPPRHDPRIPCPWAFKRSARLQGRGPAAAPDL